MSNARKAYRSSKNYIIAGVCGGLAEYFETDPLILRVIFIILGFIGLSGIFLYIFLWILMPTEHPIHSEHSAEDAVLHPVDEFAQDIRRKMARNHNHAHGILGVVLILIGALFLFDNFYPGFVKFWPLVLIVIGVAILLKDHDRYDHHDHRRHG